MAITGALAAAARVFDPYPEFDNVRVFKGRPETGGRQFYKTAGLIVPRFEMVPGVQIVGGAGFGQREINAAWRGARADEPLIGDGGLRNAEVRTNSYTKPTLQGFAVPSTYPSDHGVDANGISAYAVVGAGREDGLDYVDMSFTNSTGITRFPTLRLITNNRPAASSGQTWTGEYYAKILSGAAAVGMWPLISGWNSSGAGTSDATSVSNIKSVGAVRTRVAASLTLANAATISVRLGAQLSVPDGATIVVRIYAPNLKLGADINDPPILQDSGLPATRTGYAYQESRRVIAPVHYGVARARIVAPLANHAVNFPLLLDVRASSGAARVLWYGQKSDGTQRIRHWGDDGIFNTITLPASPVVGECQTVAWARRAGALVVSRNGETVLTTAISAVTSPFSRIGYMGDAATAGADPANAETELVLTQNGEISDADLQALSARFAA